MNKSLVILAAGMGSRYGGLKQMEPVGPSGEFLVDYAVYDAIQAGFNRVVFVIRKDMAELFDATIGARMNAHIRVEYVFQNVLQVPEGVFAPATRKKPWGTGHALLVSKELVKSPFAVINADDFYGRSAFMKASAFFDESKEESEYAIVGYPLMQTLPLKGEVSRGVCSLTPDGRLQSVVERTRVRRAEGQVEFFTPDGRPGYLSGKELASMNMWAFKPKLFEYLEHGFREFIEKNGTSKDAEYYLVTAIDDLIRKRKISVKVFTSDDSWFGVTNPEDRPVVLQKIGYLVDQKIYPESLWAG
jgi:UTP-glucose-1-phosphate uridylyltransferase